MNINVIICGLPSKKIKENCAVLVVKHPVTKELIVLKNRLGTPVHEDDLTFYDKHRNPYHHYDEMRGMKILFDWRLLGKRGLVELLLSQQ